MCGIISVIIRKAPDWHSSIITVPQWYLPQLICLGWFVQSTQYFMICPKILTVTVSLHFESSDTKGDLFLLRLHEEIFEHPKNLFLQRREKKLCSFQHHLKVSFVMTECVMSNRNPTRSLWCQLKIKSQISSVMRKLFMSSYEKAVFDIKWNPCVSRNKFVDKNAGIPSNHQLLLQINNS